MRNVLGKIMEKIEPHILCSVIFFINRAINEIKCKNSVEPDRPRKTIWRMRITCWLTKATNTQSVKVKQSRYRPGQTQRLLRKLRYPDFMTTAQDGGRLSALRTGRFYPRKYSWYSFVLEAESTPGP